MSKKPDASKVKYNKEAMRKGMKRPELEDGWYPFLTDNPRSDVVTTGKWAGAMTLNVDSAALRDAQDPTSKVKPTVRDGCFLPLDNPDWPGHEAPSWAWGISSRFFQACFDDGEKVKVGAETIVFYHAPRWKDGDLYFKGKKVDPDGEEEYREEFGDVLWQLAVALYGDPSPLKNRFYYAKIGKRKPEDRFKNILEYSDDAPAEGLVDLSAADTTAPNRAPTRRRRKKGTKK